MKNIWDVLKGFATIVVLLAVAGAGLLALIYFACGNGNCFI